MSIDMLDIEARIDRGEKLSRSESGKIMRYLNERHFNRMDTPSNVRHNREEILKAQARTRAKVRLNTDYNKIY